MVARKKRAKHRILGAHKINEKDIREINEKLGEVTKGKTVSRKKWSTLCGTKSSCKI